MGWVVATVKTKKQDNMYNLLTLEWLRSVGKHSSLGGPQRLNRVDLYGKNLIPMEKF